MAVLILPGFSDIEFPSGAKLHVYQINNTTPVSLYATSALGSGASLSNPVVANASGHFAQIFVPDGATYDVYCTTSADIAISGASWQDVPALGETPDTLTRDFGSGGRIKITGTAGAITFAAGDASPDNSGGDLTFEGWNDTPLDTLVFRSNDTAFPPGAVHDEGGSDFTVDGEVLQDGAKRTPDLIWLEGSGSATPQIDLAIPTDYDTIEIELTEIVSSAGASLALRFSYDSGSTYKATSGDYITILHKSDSGGASATYSSTSTFIPVIAVTTGANYKGEARIKIVTSSTANVATTASGTGSGIGTSVSVTQFAGVATHTFGRATHVRIMMTTGNITARYRMIAKRGLGGTAA